MRPLVIGMATTEWLQDSRGEWYGGGTQYYRMRLPSYYLTAAGHDVILGRLMRHPRDPRLIVADWKDRAVVPDVVILQRYMREELAEDILRAREAGQVVINDVDDSFDDLPTSNRAWWTTHPDPKVRARRHLSDEGHVPNRALIREHLRHCDDCPVAQRENREHYQRALAASDALTVSTAYLHSKLSELGPQVFLIRNALEPTVWERRDATDTTEPLVGWYGALGFRAQGDMTLLREVLPTYMDRHPEARFVHGGASDDRDEMLTTFGLQSVAERVESRRAVPIDKLRYLIDDFDVGLVPLELSDFNAAKSYLKGAELAMSGAPFVASPTPEYEWLGEGILARGSGEWLDALERLRDPAERRCVADAAHERVRTLCIDHTWREWEQTYRFLVAAREAA